MVQLLCRFVNFSLLFSHHQNDDKPKNYTYDADTADDDENENEAKEPLPPGMDEDDLKPPGMDEDDAGSVKFL